MSSKCEVHRIGHLLTLDEARRLSYSAEGAPRWEELDLFDEFRLRDAPKKLHQMPLITCNDRNDSYSMHPLICTWVRERPEMSTAEQAFWCMSQPLRWRRPFCCLLWVLQKQMRTYEDVYFPT